ncbi:MAG: EscU/YscU/HrcU family type III secretion system export apparatus switch protein [Kiloniellaceae bacterium]
MNDRAKVDQTVTQKPRPERSPERTLAIALENVTPEAVAGAVPGRRSDRLGDSGSESTHRGAPRVTASGRGAVAEQILQIAFERGVKVRSDSDLAEILAAVEVDSEIPLAALAGVAEILRYLYSTDAHGGAAPNNTASANGPDGDEETRP